MASLLFVVNDGDNTISSLRTTGHGLKLVDRLSSGGVLPVSLTRYGHLLYVVNEQSSTIAGFHFSDNGHLSSIPGSSQLISPLFPSGTAPPNAGGAGRTDRLQPRRAPAGGDRARRTEHRRGDRHLRGESERLVDPPAGRPQRQRRPQSVRIRVYPGGDAARLERRPGQWHVRLPGGQPADPADPGSGAILWVGFVVQPLGQRDADARKHDGPERWTRGLLARCSARTASSRS